MTTLLLTLWLFAFGDTTNSYSLANQGWGTEAPKTQQQ